jgi:DNA-binding GntR family transcriptional regulator
MPQPTTGDVLPMSATAAPISRPRASHRDLAERILDIARQRGLGVGGRLPEQQIASSCNVSRTPVRAALRLLQEQGIVRREPDAGYCLAVDLTARTTGGADLPHAAEDDLAQAILRDRAARRLDGTITVSGVMRRYSARRSAVLNALKRLSEDNLLEKAPGQSWLFRSPLDGADAQAESYEFRLLLEPAAIVAPGFRLDDAGAAVLRERMEALLALSDGAFDIREFQKLDAELHDMIAAGAANRFLVEALAAHLRLRRLPGVLSGVNVYRLRQSTREHLAILDQLENRQFEAAADLLRVHLRLSRSQRPQAANRGAPALFGAIARPG